MLIKRLNKVADILNKRNHAAGIGPDIDQIQIIITLKPGDTIGHIALKTTWHDHSQDHTENSSSRFWDSVPDNFDLQKYMRGNLDQLNGK